MSSTISWPTFKKPSKLNAYHILVISFIVLTLSFECFLKLKQIFYLLNVKFPAEFAKRELHTEVEWHGKVKAHIIAESIDLVYKLCDGCIDVLIFYFGVLPWLWQVSSKIMFVQKIADKSKPIQAEIYQSIVLLTLISLLNQLIKFPFALTSAILEGQDPLESLMFLMFTLVGSVTIAFISTGISGVIKINLWHRFPSYAFGMDLIFSLLFISSFNVLTYILFSSFPSTFKHLGTDSFGTQTSALANKLGFPVKRIFVCSYKRMVNAHYIGGLFSFAGHITVYQGLLNKLSLPAAVSVMGHEFGHWYLLHDYKKIALGLLLLVGSAILFCWLAFKPGVYTALGFEPPKQKTQEEELQSSTQAPNAPPHKSPSKFKAWLMPYYIVSLVLTNYYERPFIALSTYSSLALTHLEEFEADSFSATHTSKENMLDVIYQLHEHAIPQPYTGVGDPFVDLCTNTHPHTVNRAKAIEDL